MAINLYSKKFFDDISNGSYLSAQKICVQILNFYKFKSFVDVGCGRGAWSKAFSEMVNSEDYVAIDGEYVNKDELMIPKSKFISYDLTNRFSLDRKFDIAICLEVAEHLPFNSSESIVSTLTSLADVIVFSAAIPNQKGTFHINEQYPEFWAKIFDSKGYKCYDILRDKIWNDNEIKMWYRQNVLIFVNHNSEVNNLLKNTTTDINNLTRIHPEYFNYFSKQSEILENWKDIFFYKLVQLKKRIFN